HYALPISCDRQLPTPSLNHRSQSTSRPKGLFVGGSNSVTLFFSVWLTWPHLPYSTLSESSLRQPTGVCRSPTFSSSSPSPSLPSATQRCPGITQERDRPIRMLDRLSTPMSASWLVGPRHSTTFFCRCSTRYSQPFTWEPSYRTFLRGSGRSRRSLFAPCSTSSGSSSPHRSMSSL